MSMKFPKFEAPKVEHDEADPNEAKLSRMKNLAMTARSLCANLPKDFQEQHPVETQSIRRRAQGIVDRITKGSVVVGLGGTVALLSSSGVAGGEVSPERFGVGFATMIVAGVVSYLAENRRVE
jgi:hypothetical protein